jgi:hypothetical protein
MPRLGITRTIPKRKRFFYACEGNSELGYSRLLVQLAGEKLRDSWIPFHFDAEALQPGAGDPFGLISGAVKKAGHKAKTRGSFRRIILQMDDDGFGRNPDRDAQAIQLANRHDILLIRQTPDFEGFLLRHLPSCENLHPMAGQSETELRKRWPEYRKGMTGMELRAPNKTRMGGFHCDFVLLR